MNYPDFYSPISLALLFYRRRLPHPPSGRDRSSLQACPAALA